MAGEEHQEDLSIFATAIPPLSLEDILEPRLKAVDFSPIQWGSVSVSIQNGHVAYFEVKTTRKCIDV